MLLLRTLIQCLCCFFISQASFAQENTIPAGITAILNSFGESIDIGIIVQSLNTGEILFSKNPNRLFIPASNMKLFTGFAALSYLHPDFRYQTQLLQEGTLSATTLQGNLIFKFTGDPDLTPAHLEDMLRASHIQTVTGKLFLDDTAIDRIGAGPGWMWDDLNYCSAAPATALILNHNCFSVGFKPTQPIGTNTHAQLLAAAPITLQDRLIIQGDCPLEVQSTGSNHYTLQGCIDPKQTTEPLDLAIRNPRAYIEETLKNILRKNNIHIAGGIAYKKAEPNLTILASHESRPLSELLTQMEKDSDNLLANLLFKTLGGTYFHTTGNWHNGSLAMQHILLSTLGIQIPKNALRDGSGTSRYNLITPEHVAKLLNTVYQTPAMKSYFINSLAIGGIDGTLKERLQEPNIKGKVHAKTGNMQGITALSGYLATRDHQPLLFVILINGFSDANQKYQNLQDQICQYLGQVSLSN